MSTEEPAFVVVDRARGRLSLSGRPYTFLGANLWYGAALGAAGLGGDRPRLARELDRLAALGAKNLRILAGSEGPDSEPWRMVPALQPAPGQYDGQQLEGLDHLLAEMAKRDMKAVLCLGNMWPWSGGFAAYVHWAGAEQAIPYPGDSTAPEVWQRFQRYAAQFFMLPRALDAYWAHVERLVTRTNAITGTPYRVDPTIMSWQLANEPRGDIFADAYLGWVERTASLIKRLAPRQLVSIGSEGTTPWPQSAGTCFREAHQLSNVDYATFHLWLQNWTWFEPESGLAGLRRALREHADAYLEEHIRIATDLRKPLVLEELGLCRDGGSLDGSSPCTLREHFYRHIFERVADQVAAAGSLCGVNFWAWSGEGRPTSPGARWSRGDPYTGDPPHEPQGWYGVYDSDASTLALLRGFAKRIAGG